MTKAKVIDIGDIDTVETANNGYELEIYNPKTRADMGVVFCVHGQDSDLYKKNAYDQLRKHQGRMSRGGFRGNNMMPSPEEIDKNAIELLAAAIISWKTKEVKDNNGKVISPEKDTVVIFGQERECNYENALLAIRIPDIRRQVESAVSEPANFIKN